MKNKSGIYLIHCSNSNKVYIGSSVTINRRWYAHHSTLKHNKHPNQHLQNAYNLYGKNSFSFSILEVCSKELFVEKESYWIRFYDSTNPDKGYNLDIPDQLVYPENTNEKKIKVNPIVCINKVDGVVTRYVNCGICSNELRIPSSKIQYILNYWNCFMNGLDLGKNNLKSCHNFIFVKEEDYKDDFDYVNYKVLTRNYDGRKKAAPRSFTKRAMVYRGELKLEKFTRSILVEDLLGNQQIFKSVTEGIKTLGLNTKLVYKCLGAEFKKYKTGGYYIKYL